MVLCRGLQCLFCTNFLRILSHSAHLIQRTGVALLPQKVLIHFYFVKQPIDIPTFDVKKVWLK